MNISLNWLKEFIDISDSPVVLAETLTNLGLAVDGFQDYTNIKGGLEGVVVGKIMDCQRHPNADRLSLTQVDIGSTEPLQIVCGAPNVAAGQTVLVATLGASLHNNKGETLVIKKGKIRGEVSEGMICAGDELGISDDHSGILILSDHYTAGSPASTVYPIYNDTVFEVDLTPNRSDATSHMGVAKDLAAFYQIHTVRELKFRPILADLSPSSDPSMAVKVILEDELACPRYSGISISGVLIADSPDWLKNHLKAIGLRPINNIVDITNWILHAMGQPLHAFDLDKINERTIRIKKLKDKTKFISLDSVERNLSSDDLMVCDGASAPMCIAGVFGGLGSGISDQTKNIFLESAHFNASSVRRSSMRHGLRTDAAQRFEKGTDPNITLTALIKAAAMIVDLAGGQIASDIIDVYPQPIKPEEIEIRYDQVNKVIGQKLDSKYIIKILDALDMVIVQANDLSATVKVPTNKSDVKREIDIIEEILRIHGFNSVPMPAKMEVSFANSSAENKKYGIKESIAAHLSSLGFNEMMSLSLMESRLIKNMPIGQKDLVYIHNTSNVHLDIMRPDILMSGLQNIQYNQNRQQTNLKLYEFGHTYHKAESHVLWPFKESPLLAIYLYGQAQADHWQKKEKQDGFFYIKGLVHQLLAQWSINQFEERELVSEAFSEAFEINWADQSFIKYGKIDIALCQKFDLKDPLYYAEIKWEALSHRPEQAYKISPLNKYPFVSRDLSITVDKSVRWVMIKEALEAQKIKNLKSFRLFDIFENEERLGKDKKSMAINFIFEDLSQTLKDTDLEKSMNQIQAILKEKVAAVTR